MIASSRVCIRFPCELPAEITFSGGGTKHVKRALISNISTTGIQILSPFFIATGQMVQATFKVPGQSSKTVLRAEVMRIESLQGRTGHYPFALGAKFVTPESKQENQIMGFITRKINCARRRFATGFALIVLAGAQLAQIVSLAYTATDISFVDLFRAYPHTLGQISTHPLFSAVMSLGFFSTALLCLLNRRSFIIHAFFWTTLAAVVSIFRIITEQCLFAAYLPDGWNWSAEAVLLGLEILFLAWLFKLAVRLKRMGKILAAEKISPGRNSPTFTIL